MAEDFEVTGGLPEDDENRTFVIAAAGLGGLIVLSLICLGVYALILQPRQREAAERRPTEIVLTNTAVALGLTQTVEAAQFTPVPTEPPPTFTSTVEPTDTEVPTQTQVVVLPTDTPTSTPFTTLPTLAPLTATAAAQLTATAEAIAGAASPTPTALPTTGFADDVGLPGLAALAAIFLGAIFLSRRLRSGPSTAN